MKTCGGPCAESKPVSEFGRNAYYDLWGAKDGLARNCLQCNREISAKRNAAVREREGRAMPIRKPAVIAKKKTKEIRDGTIDAGLLLLSMITPRGIQLSVEEIAFVCGCSISVIKYYQTNALRKLKRRASKLEGLRALSTNGSGDSYGISTIYFAA